MLRQLSRPNTLVRLAPAARFSHSLEVPVLHAPYTQFDAGIPVEQVRDLSTYESKWEFWTTSPAHYPVVPKTFGYVLVPEGQVWIVERAGKFSRALSTGNHIVIPFLDKITRVKHSNTIVQGCIQAATTADGAHVDAYAVLYFKVADFAKSAYFLDPESNKADSERTAARLARTVLAQEIAKVKLSGDKLAEADASKVGDAILSALKAQEAKLGLTFSTVEVRGAYPVSLGVPNKLRALEEPHPDFEAPGHGLSNDYWEDVMTPHYFLKNTFGSSKTPVTPAAISLEWSVPSPPDFHHFNQVPKLTAPPVTDKKVAEKH